MSRDLPLPDGWEYAASLDQEIALSEAFVSGYDVGYQDGLERGSIQSIEAEEARAFLAVAKDFHERLLSGNRAQ